MITYVEGNLFESPAQVLVNTVNTVGVMGKGIAYEFKRLFPGMFEQYRDLCERNELTIGRLWLYKTPNKWILNFPTKRHWRNPSRPEYIEAGLKTFAKSYGAMGIHSIAFPPLGCGNGQLDFGTQVQPLMEKYLRNLPIEVFVYPSVQADLQPEHLVPEETANWLRSEPSSLPFAEVWEDLVQLLSSQDRFYTVSGSSGFTVQIGENPLGLLVETAGSDRYFVTYESLQAFWQQLRMHGFTYRQIAPDMTRMLSYILPVFALLPYVSLVRLSEEYHRLDRNPSWGLRLRPNALPHSTPDVQLPLFALM